VAATIVFILFAIAGGNSPDLTSLAVFPTAEACDAAAIKIKDALAGTEDSKLIVCFSSDSLTDMAKKNGLSPGN
jgi:hypothetical protein